MESIHNRSLRVASLILIKCGLEEKIVSLRLLNLQSFFEFISFPIVLGTRVTRLGKILPFGQFFMALGKFFSRKNNPMIGTKF